MKFRKRPIEVEATQYQPGVEIEGVVAYRDDEDYGSSPHPPCNWFDEHGHRYPARGGLDAFVATSDGWLHVLPGDWVITGASGMRHVCKPDVFEATYELVETGDPGWCPDQEPR